jgi:hypothetical protein
VIGSTLINVFREEETLFFSIIAEYDEYQETYDFQAAINKENEIVEMLYEGTPLDSSNEFHERPFAAYGVWHMEIEQFVKSGKDSLQEG